MSLSNVVRAAFLGGALSLGGCSVATPVRELHQQGTPYSVDEVLRAYNNEIVPLYADADPGVVFSNLNSNKDEIFRLMRTYLSEVDEQSVASASPDQRRAMAVAYGDYGFVVILKHGAGSAVPVFERAIELDPQNVGLHVRYANVLYLDQRFQEASVAVERCLQLDPSNEDARLLGQYIRSHQ